MSQERLPNKKLKRRGVKVPPNGKNGRPGKRTGIAKELKGASRRRKKGGDRSRKGGNGGLEGGNSLFKRALTPFFSGKGLLSRRGGLQYRITTKKSPLKRHVVSYLHWERAPFSMFFLQGGVRLLKKKGGGKAWCWGRGG